MVNVRKVGATHRSEENHGTYVIRRRHRHWEVRDPSGELVCLTVYKCGAEEVVRRLCESRYGTLTSSPMRSQSGGESWG
jgi:hypothetical protein